MIRVAAAAALLLAGASQDPQPAQTLNLAAQVVVRERIIIRVPNGERRVVEAGSSLIRWRESGGPRCISASNIVGARMGQSSVDLIMRDNSRIRARLAQRCAGLDYYRGFYVNATADGRICADRDMIRSRAGGQCEIEVFRTLRPIARR